MLHIAHQICDIRHRKHSNKGHLPTPVGRRVTVGDAQLTHPFENIFTIENPLSTSLLRVARDRGPNVNGYVIIKGEASDLVKPVAKGGLLIDFEIRRPNWRCSPAALRCGRVLPAVSVCL
jgi:hypothetical protein